MGKSLFEDPAFLEALRMDCAKRGLRLDAGETAALSRQLEHMYAKTYDVKHGPLKSRQFVPIDTSVDTGAEFFTYRQWDMVGMADLIANFADDLPRVDAAAKEFTAKIHSMGAAFGYSIQDLRRSAKAGSQLDSRRASAARRAHDQKFDQLVALGNADAGLVGFLNHPNVPIVAPTTGQWVTNSATPQEKLADLNKLASSIVITTLETFVPDTLLLDNDSYEDINSTPFSTTGDSDKTILRYFLDNNPYIRNVDQWSRLNTAGAGGVSRAVCYFRSEEVVAAVEPQPFEQLPPQWKNLEAVIPTHSRIGGVRVQYPFGMAYMDDLSG